MIDKNANDIIVQKVDSIVDEIFRILQTKKSVVSANRIRDAILSHIYISQSEYSISLDERFNNKDFSLIQKHKEIERHYLAFFK